MGNPLDYAAPPRPAHQRWLRAMYFSAAAWPVLILGGIYGEWLLAWAILGHRPIPPPSPDDPKTTLGLAHDAMTLITITWPMGMMLGLGSIVMLSIRRRSVPRSLLWAMALIGIWGGLIAMQRWDPLRLRVIEWFFD